MLVVAGDCVRVCDGLIIFVFALGSRREWASMIGTHRSTGRFCLENSAHLFFCSFPHSISVAFPAPIFEVYNLKISCDDALTIFQSNRQGY